MATIKVQNVYKKYGQLEALNNVSLEFKESKIYGLLGRNGAGKSSLINIITNRVFATNGNIYIDDENVVENDSALSKVFCMSEKSAYPLELSVNTAFKYAIGYYPNFDLSYALELCKKFSLDPKKRIKSLSTGYKSIYKLIITLASNAEIYIFDEPTLGLDATSRSLFYNELLQNYSITPRTIIFSTHLIDEVANLFEHVIIIDNGKIIIDCDIEEALALAYTISGKINDINKYIENKKVLSTSHLGSFLTATIWGKPTTEDLKTAQKNNFEINKTKLQDVFVKLTLRENEGKEAGGNHEI